MSQTAQAYLAGEVVRHAYFVQFNFVSGTKRVWNGFRNLTIDSVLWEPVGPLATIDQIEDPVSDTAPSLSFRVSGVDASLLAKALAESAEIQGQLAFVYDQFFDADWQPLDTMETYAVVRMDTIKITRTRNADGSYTQVITLSAEHFLTNGPNPPAGRYSAADQATRYPGQADTYFNMMQANQNRRQRWPTF